MSVKSAGRQECSQRRGEETSVTESMTVRGLTLQLIDHDNRMIGRNAK